jgi:hypothetical protein
VSSDVTVAIRKELAKAKSESQRWDRRVEALQAALAALKGDATRSLVPKRRPMGAAERRAVSKRMKKYWAKRRAQKKL